MVLRPLFNTETNMVLKPLKYGVTTILIFNISKYLCGISTTQIWCYDHSNI